ncbi:tripartite tricarboxylate transporter substrate binding protein [Roseomonas gilardii]|uniref:Bug family tripartite tricarboxylate transporter substrate binding protein n=1 Tax=Roseomonas gilardii TaxID=257708 RepID=UPI0011A8D46A|nr:tripartite tricarboxylate transporter substrate binding protein [Roseomonas gilardii]
MNRRGFLIGTGSIAGCVLRAVPEAWAQGFPARPIRLVVPYPPGGASDVTARLLAQKLNEAWGQPVTVENRPGANGIIACEVVATAAPDGYTLLMGNVGPNAINQTLYRSLPYNCITSFAPITLTTVVPIVLVANPNLPARNIRELVSLAKSRPGEITYASAGPGSSNHLTGEMLKIRVGADMQHVPYRGDGPAMTDVMAGRVSMMFATAVAAMSHIQSGAVRPLGVAVAKRIPALPAVATIVEQGIPDFDAASWGGILAPAQMPAAIIERYHAELMRILAMPDVRERLAGLGAEIVGNRPDEFAAYIKAEIDKWGAAVRASGANPEG